MKSKPLLMQGAPLMRLALLCGALSVSACSTPGSLTVPVADSLRHPCLAPDDSWVVTVGDMEAFSLQQDAALVACDARRDALVQAIDAHNKAVRR